MTGTPRGRRWGLLVAIGAVGLAIRAWVLATPLGELNSDEALCGLIAKHILHGELPLVVPGNPYIAPLEGYLYLPIAVVFGYHFLALKVLAVAMWAAASWCTYLAARRIGLSAAWLAGALVWLAPGMLMVLSLRMYVGYPSGLAVAALTVWALAHLLDTEDVPDWRWSATFGFLAGAAIYLHPIYLTAVVPLAIVPSVRFITKVRAWWLPVVAAGLAAGAPLIFWNLRHGWASLRRNATAFPEATYLDRLTVQFTGALPRALGVRTQSGDWLFGAVIGTILVAVIVVAALAGIVLLMRRPGTQRAVGCALAITIVMVEPLLAGLHDTFYTLDARYMSVIWLFLALGITALVSELHPRWRRGAAVVTVALAVGVLTVPMLVKGAGTHLADPNARFHDFADRIEAAGFDKVAGSYWLVHSVEIAADGRLTVRSIGPTRYLRFPDSDRTVKRAPDREVVFLFTPQEDDPARLRLPLSEYVRVVRPGGVLYLPRR